MTKYFFSILMITLLIPNLCAAENFVLNADYLIDEAQIFTNNQLDKKDIIKNLNDINQNPKLSLKIITLTDNANLINYCRQNLTGEKNSQVILVYDKKNNQLQYCNWSKNSIDITNDELNYIVGGIAQPNIDNNHLTFALRMAIQEIERANNENIAIQHYQAENSKKEMEKQIIIFVFIIIFFSWFTAFLGKTKSWWIGGIIGFGLGALIWLVSNIWFFMPIFLISGFICDYFVSRHYKEYSSCKKGKFWCSFKKFKK